MNRRGGRTRPLWRVEADRLQRGSDTVVVEEPLEIGLRAGGMRRTVAVTMRTPGHDYELAAGFLYSEGVIAGKHELSHMVYCVDGSAGPQHYNSLAVHLRAGRLPELPGLERHFVTNSACGVCGVSLLDELDERRLPPVPELAPLLPGLICELPDRLRAAQALFERTGGLHAAALFDLDGRLLALREDIGRHNAMDKLVGWGLLNRQLPFHDRLVLVSSRASYELLQKCRMAGAPIFCAVSAPSSLAIDLAERFDITLIGFVRGRRYNIYSHPRRIAA